MRAVYYARVSSERQEQEDTIASQIDALKSYAKAQGYELIGGYADNGYSGELLARPDLDRLRDAAEDKKFERVLILSPDRLARRFAYQEIVIDDLKKHGVTVEFLNRKIADTPEDKLLLGVQGIIAEYEKAKIMERCRRGKLHKARKGLVVGTRAPYGYRYILKTSDTPGRYEIIEEQAAVIRSIFDLMANQGYSSYRAAEWVSGKNIPPPWGKCGDPWHKSTIINLLRNETYAGTTHYNKHYSMEGPGSAKYRRTVNGINRLRPRQEWIPISVPAIISRDIFVKAQAQLARNKAFSKRNTRRQYLLQGLVVCGNCESAYVGAFRREYISYRCNQRQKIKRTVICHAPQMSARILESLVWGKVTETLRNPEEIAAIVSRMRKADMTPIDREREVAAIARERQELRKREDLALEGFTIGGCSPEALKIQMDKIKAAQALLDEREARLEASKAHQVESESLEDVCRLIVRGLRETKIFEDRQRCLRGVVSRIVMEPQAVRIKIALPSRADISGSIGSITSKNHGLNQPFEFEVTATLSRNT